MGGADASIGEVRLLAQGSLVSLGGFQHHAEPHHDPDDEIFTNPTIIFTHAGSWHIQSHDGWRDVHPGVVVAGYSGQHYRCRHDRPIPTDRTVFLAFRGPLLDDFLSQRGRTLSPGVRTVAPSTPPVRHLQDLLLAEATRQADPLELDLLALTLLVEVSQLCGESIHPVKPGRYRDQVETAKEYLRAHLSERVDLASLARVAGFSPYHFARVFRTHAGQSPHQYLVGLRIARAARLLRTSSLSVTQIRHEAGFGSLSHFITTFRRYTGTTPSEYRS